LVPPVRSGLTPFWLETRYAGPRAEVLRVLDKRE
jgi:hypothetical protein